MFQGFGFTDWLWFVGAVIGFLVVSGKFALWLLRPAPPTSSSSGKDGDFVVGVVAGWIAHDITKKK
jgi:hypothetical protein